MAVNSAKSEFQIKSSKMTTPDLPTAVMNLAKLIEGLQNFLQQMQNSQMQMQKELQEQLMEMKV